MSNASFAVKYRPRNFSELIGHETAVTRMKGMIASGNIPSAIMITGPSSSGKTTLARCFAAEVNKVSNVEHHPDLIEVNAGSERSIDDVRGWIKSSRFKPQTNKKIILIDEASSLTSVPASLLAILKPIEEASKDTIWVFASMETAGFASGKGKALANRCQQFALNPHSSKELFKQVLRISKAEKLSYLLDTDKQALKAVVKNCNSEMRTAANLVQSLQQFYDGLKDKPEFLTAQHITDVIESTEASDDKLAVMMLVNLYNLKFAEVQKGILDIKESFMFFSKLLYLNTYLLNHTVLNGERHAKVWPNVNNKMLLDLLKNAPITLSMIASTNAALVEVKAVASTFTNDSDHLLSAKLYQLIIQLKAMQVK